MSRAPAKKVPPILDTHEQDWAHLVLAPVWALALGLLVGASPLAGARIAGFGLTSPVVDAFLGAFVMAHLVIVFFRSHADPEVRARHPVRFWVVPPALLVALAAWKPALAAASALAAWWDVYHSSLQTFGIGRIFDRNAGNDPEDGRLLDWILSLLLYAGPILSGAMLTFHVRELYELEEIGWSGAGAFVWTVIKFQPRIRGFLLAAGAAFAVLYLAAYVRLARGGYKPPPQKVALHLGTAVVSIWAWGFNPLGMALFIMNFFHAWQYFALVWRYQREHVTRLFRLPSTRNGRLAALGVMVACGFAYGTVFGVLGEMSDKALALTLVVSLMHFWYDGFVWSVRKKQV